ncbi:competence protein CoiA family protein [Bradyrhizobium liaoningense]
MTRLPARSQKPRRIIEAAFFEKEIGPVSATELLAMTEDAWGILRDRLTDYAREKESGLLARCLMCEGRVFIQSRMHRGKRLPYFAHFKGGDPNCPWHRGMTMKPDDARAAQYQGRQESIAHRLLCEQLDLLARDDPRYLRSSVATYLPPTENSFGRYPDVYIEWEDFPAFAIEVQLSNTFQTEVSARSIHYQREGIPLIWVLYGIDPGGVDVPQSFRDVIRRHRGNAFVLDKEAINASRAEKTIVLKCFLRNVDGSFDGPVLTRIDQLTFPKRGLPYLEDRITSHLREQIDAVRRPWFKTLEPLREGWDWRALDMPEVLATLDHLRKEFPKLSHWETGKRDEDFTILRLVAVAFSILSTANGHERNYATRHPNVRALLNTLLHIPSGIQRYALLVELLLQHTALCGLLDGTVGQHIKRAKAQMEGNLSLSDDPEWAIMRHLVPEVFDPLVREELIYLQALPAWATPIT